MENKEEFTKTTILLIISFGACWAFMHFILGHFIKGILRLTSMYGQFPYWYWGGIIFMSICVFGLLTKGLTQHQANEAIIKMAKKK